MVYVLELCFRGNNKVFIFIMFMICVWDNIEELRDEYVVRLGIFCLFSFCELNF